MREEVLWSKAHREQGSCTRVSGVEVPEMPVCPYLDHYHLWSSWGRVLLLEVQMLKTLSAWSWAARTSPYTGKEELPRVAAACNGRGDPPAARWPGKERIKRHLAGQSLPSSSHVATPQPAPGPASPTSMRFLSLSSSCRRWVSRSPSSFRASSCRRLSSWLRSFSRVALRWIWRRETTVGTRHRGDRCEAAQR